MKIYQTKNPFLNFVSAVLKSKLYFKYFVKKMILIAYVFPK